MAVRPEKVIVPASDTELIFEVELLWLDGANFKEGSKLGAAAEKVPEFKLSGDIGVLNVAVIRLLVGTCVELLTGVTEITVGPTLDVPPPPQLIARKEAVRMSACLTLDKLNFTNCSLG